MATSHLLYLHGFRSSPQSLKARQVATWMQAHRPDVAWWCPQLPPSPRQAMDEVMTGIATWPREGMAVIGSSLGGFYAMHVAEVTGCPTVLLNPAVHPHRDLALHIGRQTAYHDPTDHFFFRPEYIDELRSLAHPALSNPQRCMAIIARGDEVLDWREMVARCAGARIKLLDGGDHALSDFDHHLPDLLAFLQLTLHPQP